MSSGEISRLSRSELSRLRAVSAGLDERFRHIPLSPCQCANAFLALDWRQMSHVEDYRMQTVESRKKAGSVMLKPTQLLLSADMSELTSITVYQRTSEGFAWKNVKEMLHASGLYTNNKILSKITGKSVRTVQRLGNNGAERLTPHQSAVAYQYAKVLEHAIDVFGNQELAERWLSQPCKFLQDNVPLDMIDNPVGFQTVEDYLTRMDYGVYQ